MATLFHSTLNCLWTEYKNILESIRTSHVFVSVTVSCVVRVSVLASRRNTGNAVLGGDGSKWSIVQVQWTLRRPKIIQGKRISPEIFSLLDAKQDYGYYSSVTPALSCRRGGFTARVIVFLFRGWRCQSVALSRHLDGRADQVTACGWCTDEKGILLDTFREEHKTNKVQL
jgi:hypothetical protein